MNKIWVYSIVWIIDSMIILGCAAGLYGLVVWSINLTFSWEYTFALWVIMNLFIISLKQMMKDNE